ncbi:MAG: FHA domain-containing protein [Pseudomonadota bacterium]
MPASTLSTAFANEDTTTSAAISRQRDMSAAPPMRLLALTPEAEGALGGNPFADLPRFPVRIGRESRARESLLTRLLHLTERRTLNARPNNDLYLIDKGPVLHISREHFSILWEDGQFLIVDRGSACGTVVGSEYIGQEQSNDEAVLEPGHTLIVGSPDSPMAFRFDPIRPT